MTNVILHLQQYSRRLNLFRFFFNDALNIYLAAEENHEKHQSGQP